MNYRALVFCVTGSLFSLSSGLSVENTHYALTQLDGDMRTLSCRILPPSGSIPADTEASPVANDGNASLGSVYGGVRVLLQGRDKTIPLAAGVLAGIDVFRFQPSDLKWVPVGSLEPKALVDNQTDELFADFDASEYEAFLAKGYYEFRPFLVSSNQTDLNPFSVIVPARAEVSSDWPRYNFEYQIEQSVPATIVARVYYSSKLPSPSIVLKAKTAARAALGAFLANSNIPYLGEVSDKSAKTTVTSPKRIDEVGFFVAINPGVYKADAQAQTIPTVRAVKPVAGKGFTIYFGPMSGVQGRILD